MRKCSLSRFRARGPRYPFSLILGFMTRIFQFKSPSTWLAWILWITPASLCAQAPVDLKAEVAARRIEVARQQVARIKALVDGGLEARIRLDAAQRDLEDTKDKVILESAAPRSLRTRPVRRTTLSSRQPNAASIARRHGRKESGC